MADPRLLMYREAALAMKQGQFRVAIPSQGQDEVASLGAALIELGETLERKFEEINRLARVTEKVNSGIILDEVLNYVFESFRPIIPYHRIGFSLLEDNGNIVRARWARSDAPVMKISKGYWARLQGSSLQRIIETGQPRIINDLGAYLEEHPNSESTRRIVEEGMRSSLTCPLVALGKPVGFMFFSSMGTETYRSVHIEVFQQIAGQLSVIVEKGRLYQQLVELNEIKNRFLGMAAHDLRSPLTVLRGSVELLQGEFLGPVTTEQNEFLHTMLGSCDRMIALINELLDVNAIESGRLELKRQPADVAAWLAECRGNNAVLAKSKSVEMVLDVPTGLPAVPMDLERMHQVMNNLISNAIKFSHPNTKVIIGAATYAGHVEIWVADQGQGIPESEIDRLFNEFSRTSVRPTAGEASTGLGLAIVKRIVEGHGGHVWVESKEGIGSRFAFTVPLRVSAE